MSRIERILNKVDSFNESGRFEEAIRELKKAIEIAPDDPDVYISFALTYDAMSDLDSSIKHFKLALELCPQDCYIWTQLGITLARNNKPFEALNMFKTSLSIDPTYIVSKWNLGLTCRSIGHFEDAVSEFEQCLEIEPESEYIKEEIHYQLGLCYFDIGWTLEALKEFKLQTDLFPYDVWSHMSIGNCYFDLGWVDESAKKFQIIINDNPGFIHAYNSLAMSYAENGWYDEALDTLRQALEIDPSDETVKENIDYIESLKDDEDGLKSLIFYLLLKKALSEELPSNYNNN